MQIELRDHIATKAMEELIYKDEFEDEASDAQEKIADMAYNYADAMMKRRQRQTRYDDVRRP